MGEIIRTDETYKTWLRQLKERYQKSQIKAATAVNREMLMFYWSLGASMEALKKDYNWGSGFYRMLSKDIQRELPDVKSFSPRNLLYMHQFYKLYALDSITPQPVAQLEMTEITPQIVAQRKRTGSV